VSVATALEAAVSSDSSATQQQQLSASVQCRCEALLHALTATVDSSSSSSSTGSSSSAATAAAAADDALQRALAVSASLCTVRAAAAAVAVSSNACSSELLCTACVKLVAALAQQWLQRLPQHLPAAIQLLLACLPAETGSETASKAETVVHSTAQTGTVDFAAGSTSAQLQQAAAVALLKVCTACATPLVAALPLLVSTYLRLTAVDSAHALDAVARKLLLRAVCAVLQVAATDITCSDIAMQSNSSSSSSGSSGGAAVDVCTAAVRELVSRQLHSLVYCLEHCSATTQDLDASRYTVCAEAVAAALTDLDTLLTLVSTLHLSSP
jgi:trimeric autotransporter adhesin